MLPTGDISSDHLMFARPAAARWRWCAAAVVGAGLLLWAMKGAGGPAWTHRAALVAGVMALVAGLIGSLWDERLDLNLADGHYRRWRGVWPFWRATEARVGDFARLALAHRTGIDAYGTPIESYSLALEGPRRTVNLFRGYGDPSARDIAYRIAARTDKTVEERTFTPEHPDNAELSTRRATTGALWAGFAGVVLVMFWPVISGARPLWRRTEAQPSTRPQMLSAIVNDHFNRGWDLYRRGRMAEAAEQFRFAADKEPRSADAWNMLAYALAGQNKLDEALQAAKRALNAAPGSGIILDTVGEMYQLRGEYHQAVDYYQRALAALPPDNNAETHCKFGETLLVMGRRADAKKHLQQAAEDPMNRFGVKAAQILRSAFPGEDQRLPLGRAPRLPM